MKTVDESVQISIRAITKKDRSFVLNLNEKEVDVLSPMNLAKLELYERISEAFWIAEVEGKQAAFLIIIREGADYPNENYAFFSANFPKFLYIDRIVIDEPYKKCGIGKALYKAAKELAIKSGVFTITAEVDTEPVYNDASLRFHASQGFLEVGSQRVRGGSVKVSLLAWNANNNMLVV